PALLRNYIQQLQLEYFIALYGVVADTLNMSSNHPLCDPDFITLFQNTCAKNQIQEYCLLNDSGSFLMRDAAGQETLLVVNTEKNLKHYYELAEYDDQASSDLLHSLKHKEQVVFVPNSTEATPYIPDWQLYDAHKVQNKAIYYAIEKPKQPLLKTV